jgi:flagellum-specific ATP synthase
MAEMIRLGAYRAGSDPDVDEAIRYQPELERFLSQGKREHATLDEGYGELARILAPRLAGAEP